MREYEYSFNVESLHPYMEYCQNNNYTMRSHADQERTIYRGPNKTIARVTVNVSDGVETKTLDFKEDVINGEVFDVAVDLREGSETYGKWFGVILSAENKKQFFVPKGFAHGFAVLSKKAIFQYKCDEFYTPQSEGGIQLMDESLGINWPISTDDAILSDKDKIYPKLSEIISDFDY